MNNTHKRPYLLNAKSIKLGLRCPKAFWYKVHSEKGETDRLHQYYKLAQKQIKSAALDPLGDYTPLDYNLEATLTSLKNTLEPTQFKNAYLEYENLGIRIEALIFDGNHWSAYQVKRSLNIKQKHKLEANIISYLVQKLNLPDIQFHAWYLNKSHSLNSELPIFKTKQISPSKDGIADIELIQPELNRISIEANPPQIEIGDHCGEQGLCPFYKKCFKTEAPSIFTLRQQSSLTAIENYQKGIEKISDILDDKPLSPFQKTQRKSILNNAMFMAKGSLKGWLGKAEYPIAFIDFEGYQATIPELQHHHPMTTVPFLFSMHLLEGPDEPIQHLIHINDRKSQFPEKDFCEALVSACKGAKTFIVFNRLFETDIINRLIHFEPVYTDPLNAIKSKILDFQEVFEKPMAYHPDQNGSISLKAVSDALLSEKVFDNSWIKNGLQACKAFEYLSLEEDKGVQSEIIEALKLYCSADTYSMYLLWKELNKRLS